MDINRAKEIVSALAEGIDPITGELLPEDSVYNKGDVVRALYTVMDVIGKKKTKKNLPENAGKPWSDEFDRQLKDSYNSGVSVKEIAKEMKRTTGSISSRLVKLGLVIIEE